NPRAVTRPRYAARIMRVFYPAPRERAHRECGCDQRVVFLHQVVWIQPRSVGPLAFHEAPGDGGVRAHCLAEDRNVIERESLRPSLIGIAHESRNERAAMLVRQPLTGTPNIGASVCANGNQGQHSIRSGRTVAAKDAAVMPGLVRIVLRGGEVE